ncbi:DMT family transporter [Coralliovum pocilloporae]|uniref:DMT family transporter n=1 Tax=Coralliovum pocilloporae TaxID=3066369 RepID=UPI00330725D1
MPIYELAALAAALCWTLSGLLSREPADHLGAVGFNRIRQIFVFVLLASLCTATQTWDTISVSQAVPIILSGFIGIFLGDTALYLTLIRLGPRRTGILFAMNAPISVLLGWIFLGETLSPSALFGILLIIIGVVLAIIFGKRKDQLHQWEQVRGSLAVGVGFGLVTALSQSVGSILARPVMESGADPVAVSAIRVGIAALCLILAMQLPFPAVKQRNPLTPRIAALAGITGLLGMGIGMTLLLFALSGGSVGVISTLSATTPVLLLPLLWIKTGERPAGAAWLGAFLVVAGSSFLFIP